VKWAGEDSNLRRLCRQIYSLLPLAARAPTLNGSHNLAPPIATMKPVPPTRSHPAALCGPGCAGAVITLEAMPSFDVVSEIDRQEVRNAVDQAAREVATRFDFKGTNSTVELSEDTITLHTVSEDRLKALRQVLEEKLVKRKVSLKALEYGKVEEASGGTARQQASLVAGISSEKARTLNKFIKGLGTKGLQSQTQGEQLRVTSKKRDVLQATIQALKEEDFGIPLQFTNFRD
jgi:cyclic-di-GMP-binding protein